MARMAVDAYSAIVPWRGVAAWEVEHMANPVTWVEIVGKDSAGLQRFYREVFGWKLTPPVKEMGNYSMLQDHKPGIAGGIGGSEDDNPRVSVYIETADPESLAQKAERAGARMVMPVTQITPTTTIAMLVDPAGNTFGLLKAQPPQGRVTTRGSAPTRRAATTRRAGTTRRADTTRRSAATSRGGRAATAARSGRKKRGRTSS
jgi:uncharacterized protein